MSRIQMPPPRADRRIVVREHFGEGLYFDFTSSGYFGPVKGGIFHDSTGHDIPSGQFAPPPHIGPFVAAGVGLEEDFIFFDPSTNLAYLVIVQTI